jgi:uncharacterized protein YecT (DUF1311 family)
MLLVALLLLTSEAEADPSPYPPDPPCAESSTLGMVQCMEKLAPVWDARLKQEYGAALKRVSPQAQPALRRAQQQWVKFRDANCEMYSLHEGTVAQLWSVGCPLDMTKKRALELHDMD